MAKMWLEKGGEDFADAVRIINFQRRLHVIRWQPCIFQVLPNTLFSIWLSSFSAWKGTFFFLFKVLKLMQDMSSYHFVCSRILCYHAGCPGLKRICEKRANMNIELQKISTCYRIKSAHIFPLCSILVSSPCYYLHNSCLVCTLSRYISTLSVHSCTICLPRQSAQTSTGQSDSWFLSKHSRRRVPAAHKSPNPITRNSALTCLHAPLCPHTVLRSRHSEGLWQRCSRSRRCICDRWRREAELRLMETPHTRLSGK